MSPAKKARLASPQRQSPRRATAISSSPRRLLLSPSPPSSAVRRARGTAVATLHDGMLLSSPRARSSSSSRQRIASHVN
jgi:hypothetical protein